MLIREKLEHGDFSNSERILIDYILEAKMKIKDMTTKEIANATYTSPSTLVRIAHKMNYKGWNELKEAYLQEEEYLSSHFVEIDANYPFNQKDNIMTIANKLAKLKKESIDDTLSLITHDDLQKAVQILLKYDVIQLFAVGNNLQIAKEFQHNMLRISKHVLIQDIQGHLQFSAIHAPKNCCAIIVSYSGETPILIKVTEILKSKNIPVIVITNIGDNTISRSADVVLRICTREKLYSKIATFSTDVSIMYVLDLLYSCYFAADYNHNLEIRTGTSKLIETGRTSTLDIIKED